MKEAYLITSSGNALVLTNIAHVHREKIANRFYSTKYKLIETYKYYAFH